MKPNKVICWMILFAFWLDRSQNTIYIHSFMFFYSLLPTEELTNRSVLVT